jgi:hypothetical protein
VTSSFINYAPCLIANAPAGISIGPVGIAINPIGELHGCRALAGCHACMPLKSRIPSLPGGCTGVQIAPEGINIQPQGINIEPQVRAGCSPSCQGILHVHAG